MYSLWLNLMATLVCIVLILHIVYDSDYYTNTECLTNNDIIDDNTFQLYVGDMVYDDFYVDVYDELVYNEHKNDFEIQSIMKIANIDKTSIILDIGCGTGHHAAILSTYANHVTGLDRSKSMIKKCNSTYSKRFYPNLTFKEGDALNTLLFQPNSFSHICCFYFTIYYIKDKAQFFSNCYNWLHHRNQKGYLIVHIVDRTNFDPVVPPSSPFFYVNPQTFAKDRITKSAVVFNDFKYKAEFLQDRDESTFIEKFENKKGKVFRKNEHTFYMETEEKIVNLAKEEGFIVESKIDLLKASYEYQYLYVFST